MLGGLKTDVVVSKPGIGPCVAVSIKGTLSAFRNLTNRMEEAVGDCTNLHISYPNLVYGFLHVIRANPEGPLAVEAAHFLKADAVRGLADGVGRQAVESSAYHSTGEWHRLPEVDRALLAALGEEAETDLHGPASLLLRVGAVGVHSLRVPSFTHACATFCARSMRAALCFAHSVGPNRQYFCS